MNTENQIIHEPDGVLVVNKHSGVTSHDIVGAVRRLYHTRKVGHTGTLDPMATGILTVLIGRAAKAAEYITSDRKKYTAVMRLGIVTDTGDTTGTVLSTFGGTLPDSNRVFDVCNHFIGTLSQLPPMYSAVKINGKKLYELAREGKEVERSPRSITVYSLTCAEYDLNAGEYTLTVECSGGTYIRTLCTDIGDMLGCGAAMSALCRDSSGNFTLGISHTIDEIEKMSEIDRLSLLRSTESLFETHDIVCLSDFYSRLAHSGAEIYQEKINTDYAVGARIRIYDGDGFFALGEVREYDNGTAVKPIKLFKL